MDIKRTYFQGRVTPAEIQAMLHDRQPFFLENVADVDATAAQFEQALRAQGLVCQVRERQEPPSGAEAATLLGAGWLALALSMKSLLDVLWARMESPRPHVVIVKSPQALDVRYTRQAQAGG